MGGGGLNRVYLFYTALYKSLDSDDLLFLFLFKLDHTKDQVI